MQQCSSRQMRARLCLTLIALNVPGNAAQGLLRWSRMEGAPTFCQMSINWLRPRVPILGEPSGLSNKANIRRANADAGTGFLRDCPDCISQPLSVSG